MSEDSVFFSSIHDIEAYLLGTVPNLNVDDGLILTDYVRGLVGVSDRERVL